ncbi:MAG: FAD-dependent oxidoreductase [Hyphomicrobiaceae bacterium]
MAELPSHARVCIVGGGVMGVGLLYHLAEEGWTDTVLVEKGELTSGSTWHAAGQCPHFVGSYNLAKIHHWGTVLYPKLEELTGHAVSWHGCGGVRLALTDDEVDWFHHVNAMGKLIGYDSEVVGPNEIKRYHPHIDTFGVKAGFITFTDGHVAPADVTMAMAAGARQKGARISRKNRVTDIKREPNGEWRVITEKGDIVCQHVVNAAGSYADIVGAWTGHNVPIANMLHHYVITEPIQELIDLEPELPVVRDPYSHSYLREETNGILVGPYETSGAHTCFDDGISWDFENELVPPELDRLMPWLEKATERLPLFGKAGLKSVVSGAITHTPDSNFLLGPAPGPENYWMCCGASIGICQGGGAGKYLAEWMVHGAAEINMNEFDPRRFGDWADAEYAKVTSINDYQHMYACLPPGAQHEAGRPVRTSSLYERLKERGAQFQQVMGWERARWFDREGAGETYSFRRSNWWETTKAEAMAVRERVGLMDLSTFAKFDVKGADASAFLNRLCANDMPTKTGGIVLAHFLNDGGRILGEVTVTRLADDHYFVLSGAPSQLIDYHYMSNAVGAGETITITDITEDYGTLVLAGPKARDVLANLTDADLGNSGFRWLTGREIDVAGVSTRALRVNYVGELGWELHAPMADLPTLFDALMEAGAEYDIRLFGTYAMNALRIEKAYRGFAAELTNEITMVEGDMERFVGWDKSDFIGKQATLSSKQNGARISLVYLEVDADDADCIGGEPVYAGEQLVGVTTSGAYGFAVEKSLTFAYVEPQLTAPGTEFEIQILDRRQKARAIEQPAYDPSNERLRA